MVGGEGEEEMQLLPGVADSSSSSAAVITHFIYASLGGTEKGESPSCYRSSNSREFLMLNCAVLLSTMKIDSARLLEQKEKYLKEGQQSSPTLLLTMLLTKMEFILGHGRAVKLGGIKGHSAFGVKRKRDYVR